MPVSSTCRSIGMGLLSRSGIACSHRQSTADVLQGDILADGSHASDAKRWAAQAEGEAELAAAEAAVRSGHQVGKVLPTPEHCLVIVAHTERGISTRGSSMPPCSVGHSCPGVQCMLQGQRRMSHPPPPPPPHVRQAAACVGPQKFI